MGMITKRDKENGTTRKLLIAKTSKDVKQKVHVPKLTNHCISLTEVAMLCSFAIFHLQSYNVWHCPLHLKPKVHTLQ